MCPMEHLTIQSFGFLLGPQEDIKIITTIITIIITFIIIIVILTCPDARCEPGQTSGSCRKIRNDISDHILTFHSNPIFFSIGIPNSFSPQDPGPGPLDPGTGLAAAACPRAGSPRRRSSPRRRRRPGATGPDEGPATSGTIDLRSEIYHKSIINPRYLGVTTRFFLEWKGILTII